MIKTVLADLLRQSGESINSLSSETGISRTSLTKLVNNESKMIQFETIEKLMAHFDLQSFDELFKKDHQINDLKYTIKFDDNKISLDTDKPLCVVNFYYKDGNISYSKKGNGSNIDVNLDIGTNSLGTTAYKKDGSPLSDEIVSNLFYAPLRVEVERTLSEDKTSQVRVFLFSCLSSDINDHENLIALGNLFKDPDRKNLELLMMRVFTDITSEMTSNGIDFSMTDSIMFKTNVGRNTSYVWPRYLLADNPLSRFFVSNFTDTDNR